MFFFTSSQDLRVRGQKNQEREVGEVGEGAQGKVIWAPV